MKTEWMKSLDHVDEAQASGKIRGLMHSGRQAESPRSDTLYRLLSLAGQGLLLTAAGVLAVGTVAFLADAVSGGDQPTKK